MLSLVTGLCHALHTHGANESGQMLRQLLRYTPCTHGPGVCCVPDIQHHLLCSPALVNGQHLQEAANNLVAQSTSDVASRRQAQHSHCRNTLCLATSNMNMHMECDSTASACMCLPGMASARLCVCLQLLTLTRMSTQAGRAGSSSSGGARSLILRRYTQPASAQTRSTHGGTAQHSWQCCVRLLASTCCNTSSYDALASRSLQEMLVCGRLSVLDMLGSCHW
jgi:hypothetical protein